MVKTAYCTNIWPQSLHSKQIAQHQINSQLGGSFCRHASAAFCQSKFLRDRWRCILKLLYCASECDSAQSSLAQTAALHKQGTPHLLTLRYHSPKAIAIPSLLHPPQGMLWQRTANAADLLNVVTSSFEQEA